MIDEDYWYHLPNVSYASAQRSLEVRLSPVCSMLVKLGPRQDEAVREWLEDFLAKSKVSYR